MEDWAHYLQKHHQNTNTHGSVVKKKYAVADAKQMAIDGYKLVFGWYSVCELIGAYQYDLIIDLGPGTAMSTILTAANPQLSEIKRMTVSQYKHLDGLLHALIHVL